MSKKTKSVQADEPKKTVAPTADIVNLSKMLSKQRIFQGARFWIVGDFPLIVHAWSQKAKEEMLQKQVKATKPGKAARDPQADFISSLYEMGNGNYGFPVTGLKNAILSVSHKDKGIARSAVQGALFLEAQMVKARPALAGAICDMPLVRIYGDKPAMREDMVKIGSGLNKVASLAYRGQFTNWAFRIECKYNPTILTAEALAFLIQEAGVACGLGEWRNERRGVFGAFHLATPEEEALWEKYAAGKGPIPQAVQYQEAAE